MTEEILFDREQTVKKKSNDLQLERITIETFPELLDLVKGIFRGIKDKSRFFLDSDDYFRDHLEKDGVIFGFRNNNGELISYGVLDLSGKHPSRYGEDLGLCRKDFSSLAVLDGGGVRSDIRGGGLQRIMQRYLMHYASKKGFYHIASSVHPGNMPSIVNLRKNGLNVVSTKEKHGQIRHVMYRKFNLSAIENTALMHGTGNSFVMLNRVYQESTLEDCLSEAKSYKRFGTDAAIFLLPSRNADVRMLYFSYDRSNNGNLVREGMCGNGIRCVGRLGYDLGILDDQFSVETDDGVKKGKIKAGGVKINMGPVRNFKRINGGYYAFTGVPHYVEFMHDLNEDYTRVKGSILRNDPGILKELGNPDGILHFNVVKKMENRNAISILTREGGVEDLTLSCATGAVAAAFVTHSAEGVPFPITVHNKGGNLVISRDIEGNMLQQGSCEYK